MSKAAQLRVQALQLYRAADQLYAVNKIDAANVIYDRYLGVQHKYKAEAYLERLPMHLLCVAEHLIARKA
jgi:hypothetical protein